MKRYISTILLSFVRNNNLKKEKKNLKKEYKVWNFSFPILGNEILSLFSDKNNSELLFNKLKYLSIKERKSRKFRIWKIFDNLQFVGDLWEIRMEEDVFSPAI